MTTQIERNFEFLAGVHFQNTYVINSYNFTLTMEVNTDSIREQNVAMERIKYFIYDILEDCVFVNAIEKKIIENYNKCKLNVCVVPEEPYDQIISMLLLLKCNAITENKILVNEITLTSKLSDGVKFRENIETAQTAFPIHGWWEEAIPSISSKVSNRKDKIVQIINTCDWKELGLTWLEKPDSTSEILFSTDRLP